MEIFQLDDEGYLVNKQGYKVLSSDYFNNPQNAGIRIPNGAVQISVDKNGSIEVDGAQNARLFVAQVDDIRALQKDGDNVYKIDDLTCIRDLKNPMLFAKVFLRDQMLIQLLKW